MSGVHDAAVRDLCRQIAQETDPEKVHQLLVSLHTTRKEEQEEARLRMSDSQALSPPPLRARAGYDKNRSLAFSRICAASWRREEFRLVKNSNRSEA
jgi:hypothetical protein